MCSLIRNFTPAKTKWEDMKRFLWIWIWTFLCLQGMAQTNKTTTTGKTVVVKKTTTSKTTTAAKTTTTKADSTKANAAKTTTTKADSTKANAPKTNVAKTSSTKTATPATPATTAAAPVTATKPTATCGYLCNPPLPYMPTKLDVLFIGNSFSIDTSTALPEIFKSLGIRNVNVYVLYKGGCSMKQHYEYYLSKENVYELYKYSIQGEQKLETATNIADVMSRFAYDIVVFQQYSLDSGDYNTYEPYLSKLIQAYNLNRLSARTTFAFNETWAYSFTNKNLSKYKTQFDMWKSICSSVKQMKANTGIDVIIPCGTAVQNARAVESLNIDNDLTRDGLHINLYSGRYLLACTFFESIIAPCLGKNLRDDTTLYGKNTDIGPVNNTNRTLLQNCARLAVSNNYEISEFVWQ